MRLVYHKDHSVYSQPECRRLGMGTGAGSSGILGMKFALAAVEAPRRIVPLESLAKLIDCT
jgi:hypothetical protein